MKLIENVLKGKNESYATSLSMRKRAWMILIAPIQYEDKTTGAIISFQKISDVSTRTKNVQNDMVLHGFFAQTNFQDIYNALC